MRPPPKTSTIGLPHTTLENTAGAYRNAEDRESAAETRSAKKMEYMGPHSDGPYWFIFNEADGSFLKCTKQIRVLKRLGMIEFQKIRNVSIAVSKIKQP